MPYSIPPYPASHVGTALVIGTGPPAREDVAAALALRPAAARVGINEAGKVTWLQHLVSMHAEHMADFRQAHWQLHGYIPICHAPSALRPRQRFNDHPVDYYWNGVHSNATSAWTAIWVAQAMGYDEVILCGCPMNGGDGYAIDTAPGTAADPRFGHLGDSSGLIRGHKEAFAMFSRNRGAGVYSMSGFSRECLGAPPEQRFAG